MIETGSIHGGRSAWYAVDDSDVGNGCLQVIPGTQTGGIRAHGTSPDPTANLLSINQQVPVTAEEERRAVNVQLKAGDNSLGTRWRAVLVRGENRERHFVDVTHPFPAG